MTQLYAVEQLKEAIRELKVFMDPKNVECDVRQDARGTATQMYLESWVLAPLEEALKVLEGSDRQ